MKNIFGTSFLNIVNFAVNYIIVQYENMHIEHHNDKICIYAIPLAH